MYINSSSENNLANFVFNLYKLLNVPNETDRNREASVLTQQFFSETKISILEVFVFIDKHCSSVDTASESVKKLCVTPEELEVFCSRRSDICVLFDENLRSVLKKNKDKRYICTEDVCNILSANRQVVLGLMRSEKLPAYKLNNQYRVDYDDLISFMAENRYRRKPIKRNVVIANENKTSHKNNVDNDVPEDKNNSFVILNKNDSDEQFESNVSIANMIQEKKEKISIDI